MSLTLNRVHVFAKTKNERGETITRLVKTNPYTRIAADGQPPVFLQEGRFYAEGGQEYMPNELPGWVEAEIAKLNPVVLAECGYQGMPQTYGEVLEFPGEYSRSAPVKPKKKVKLRKKVKTASGFRRKGW